MKVDINKTYRTKSGQPVVIYAIHEGQEYAVHGAHQDVGGVWRVRTWQLNGYLCENYGTTEFDLIEARPERVVWINEYGGGFGYPHETKEDADEVREDRFALHRVVLNEDTVWKEGDDASV